jgi:predicted GTPase
MRKKAQVVDKLEKLSVADARRAIDFAEVVVLCSMPRAGWSTRISRSPRWCWKKAAP